MIYTYIYYIYVVLKLYSVAIGQKPYSLRKNNLLTWKKSATKCLIAITGFRLQFIHEWEQWSAKMLLPWKKNHPELHFSCARYYFCSTKADQKSFGPLDGLLVDKRYFQSRSTGILGTNAKTRIGADTQCSTKCTCFQTVEGLYVL